MSDSHVKRGTRGENIAADFLRSLGYEILHRNLRFSHYEIDIICRDSDCLVFVEVKMSQSQGFGHPATWIDEGKQERLRQAALLYIQEYDIVGMDLRFDAVTIRQNQVEHFKNAF